MVFTASIEPSYARLQPGRGGSRSRPDRTGSDRPFPLSRARRWATSSTVSNGDVLELREVDRRSPFWMEPNEDLQFLEELIEAGKVTPVIDRTCPMSEVPEAIRHLGSGHGRGKSVITVAAVD